MINVTVTAAVLGSQFIAGWIGWSLGDHWAWAVGAQMAWAWVLDFWAKGLGS